MINCKLGKIVNFYKNVSSCKASAVLQVNVKVWLEFKVSSSRVSDVFALKPDLLVESTIIFFFLKYQVLLLNSLRLIFNSFEFPGN